MATPPYNGAFTNYVAYPEYMVFKLPANVSTLEGALIEPLAVGLHAAKQGEVSLGSKVVILGADYWFSDLTGVQGHGGY